MRKVILIVILLCCQIFSQPYRTELTIDEIVNLQEDEIDIGEICLILAREAYPNLNTERFNECLDFMAKQVKYLGSTKPNDPETCIGLLNTYLYLPGWWNENIIFEYDTEDLKAEKIDNRYLNGIIATKQGSCVTMSMLYLALADRLDWPINAVRAPRHIYCRWIGDGFELNNIEPTVGGGFISEERYISDNLITEKTIKNGVYLKTLTKREYIASLLCNSARFYYENEHDTEKAIKYLHYALTMDSTLSEAHWNLSIYYSQKGKVLEKEMNRKITNSKDNFDVKIKNILKIDDSKEISQNSLSTYQKSMYDEFLNEHLKEVDAIKEKYYPVLNRIYELSQRHKEAANELGIVLETPDDFIIRRDESIEYYRRTGKFK